MAARNGKIANLPNDLREQLNLRLLEGETGRDLAAWLNALPEVRSVLASQFNSSPISEVNLTHWRQGGYLQWLTERECFDSARALADGDCNLAQTGLSAERLLNILTLRFGELLMRWDLSADEDVSYARAFSLVAKKARILQAISRSVLAIHRLQSPQSNSSRALPKNDPLATDPIADFASVFERPLPAHRPIAAKNCADPRTEAPSDPSPKSTRPSSPRPIVSSNPVPGLATAISDRLRTHRGRSGARPEIASDSIAPSGILSNLSHTPFKPDMDLSEILQAI